MDKQKIIQSKIVGKMPDYWMFAKHLCHKYEIEILEKIWFVV
jgi:hypothetical protein